MTKAGQVTIAGATIDYIATTGHLNALAPVSATPQASMFYVAYVRPVSAGDGPAARVLLQRRPGLGQRLAAPRLVRAAAHRHQRAGDDACRSRSSWSTTPRA